MSSSNKRVLKNSKPRESTAKVARKEAMEADVEEDIGIELGASASKVQKLSEEKRLSKAAQKSVAEDEKAVENVIDALLRIDAAVVSNPGADGIVMDDIRSDVQTMLQKMRRLEQVPDVNAFMEELKKTEEVAKTTLDMIQTVKSAALALSDVVAAHEDTLSRAVAINNARNARLDEEGDGDGEEEEEEEEEDSFDEDDDENDEDFQEEEEEDDEEESDD